jgi:hypothetical protein
LLLEKTTFTKVKMISNFTRGNGLPKDTFRTWWAKNIGIIRKKIEDGRVFRLKRFEVVK